MNIISEIKHLQESSISLTLSSIDENGYPVMRNVLIIQEKMTPNVMYFSTNTSSEKVIEYKHNNKASVYMFDQQRFTGVNMLGQIEVITDQETKNFFFKEEDIKYYKKGATDPDYTILKFTAKSAKLYQNLQTYHHHF